MSKFKVVKNFDRVSDATLLTITEGIIRALTGNSYYSSPLPTLIELTNQKIKFENALAATTNGGKTFTAIKKKERAELQKCLYLLAGYVENTAFGNEVQLLSSGFEVYNTKRSKRPVPAMPYGLKLTDGNHSGSIKAKVKPVQYADGYEWRYSQDEFGSDMQWQLTGIFSAGTVVIENLTTVKYVWVQARSFNTQGRSEWCSPVSILVR